MTRRTVLTISLAALGLAITAALAWSATQLAGQRIGLASEPMAVEQGLAPHQARATRTPATGHDDHVKPRHRAKPKPASGSIFTTTTAAPAPVTSAAAPSTVAPAPATAAPPAPAVTTASAAATRTGAGGGQVSSTGVSGSHHGDDHQPDD